LSKKSVWVYVDFVLTPQELPVTVKDKRLEAIQRLYRLTYQNNGKTPTESFNKTLSFEVDSQQLA